MNPKPHWFSWILLLAILPISLLIDRQQEAVIAYETTGVIVTPEYTRAFGLDTDSDGDVDLLIERHNVGAAGYLDSVKVGVFSDSIFAKVVEIL